MATRTSPDDVRARLVDRLGLGVLPRAPVDPVLGQPAPMDGYTVTPVSLQVYAGLRVSGALFRPEGPGPFPAVIVAHGHFGQGKSAGESQGPAHAFASNGAVAFVLDTPGVEEGDRPGRQLHFEGGEHNRALLAAAGSSAMAVQLEGLQAALDWLLAREDVTRVAVAGASGGAVQALYLTLVDPRPVAAVLASYVPMPHEARAGGCPCDVVPGWPGPDPALLAGLEDPTLWLSEVDPRPPPGLPRSATFRHLPGEHSYTAAMVGESLDFLAPLLGTTRKVPEPLPNLPGEVLASADVGQASFQQLVAAVTPRTRWEPRPETTAPFSVSCTGAGPKVLLTGGAPKDADALAEGGYSACEVRVEEDPLGCAPWIVAGGACADRASGALVQASLAQRAVAIYAVGAWAVAARGAGLPSVLRDPPAGVVSVDPARDPAWVWAPGVLWEADPWAFALAVGADPATLVSALPR